MYQNYQYEVDPKDPLKPLYQGTFEEKVTVGGKEPVSYTHLTLPTN